MKFSQVAGNGELKTRLARLVRESRISHGQMFAGPSGSGNLALALSYAQFILCTNKSETDSCGECSGCIKAAKFVHPDLHFIFPVATTKTVTSHAVSDRFLQQWRECLTTNPYLTINQWGEFLDIENKQLSINTEDCQDVIRKLSLKPYESEYKIMIIWLPEKMNHAAIPKLLKILEEPSDKTVFLLITEDIEQILATILSRVQTTHLKKLSEKDIEIALTQIYGIDKHKAERIALLSDGSMSVALNLMTENGSEFSHESFLQWMRLCYALNKPETIFSLMDWIDDFHKGGREKQKQFLALGLRTVRECLMISYDSDSTVILPEEEKNIISKFSPFISGANVMEIYQHMNEGYYEIERNVSAKMVMIDISFKIAKLLRLKPEIFAD